MGRGRGIGNACGCLIFLFACFFTTGCNSIGPSRITSDRESYSTSLNDSYKRQILLNIVRIRYVEPLLFMDVGDIVAAYSMESGVTAGVSRSFLDITSLSDTTKIDGGLSGKYTDRPTITYKPMTGASFRKAIMSPLPLRSVALALDSGVSAQFLMNLGVRSINGVRNSAIGPSDQKGADMNFTRVVETLAKLQLHNAIHAHADPGAGGEGKITLRLGCMNPGAEDQALVKEFKELLKLDPSQDEFDVTSDSTDLSGRKIVLQTYSMMQILAAVAGRVDVKKDDIAAGKALPAPSSCGNPLLAAVSVHSGGWPQLGAYSAVKFRGQWYWISDNDLATKRVVSFIMLALTMMEDNSAKSPVQMTIPVQ